MTLDTEHRMRRITPAIVIAAGLAVVAVTVFKVPLATIAWLATAAICPLMMLGMHKVGQGGHGASCHGHAEHEKPEHEEPEHGEPEKGRR